MSNFREMAAQFSRAGAWRRVDDWRELAEVWGEWLGSRASAAELGRLGQQVFLENRGALARTTEILQPVFEETGDPQSDDSV